MTFVLDNSVAMRWCFEFELYLPLPRMNSESCEERRKYPKQCSNHDQSLYGILLAARSCSPGDIDPISDPCA